MAAKYRSDDYSNGSIDAGDLARLAWAIPVFLLCLFGVYAVWQGIYTVAAHEKAVVLRFGKFHSTAESGLHFKIPLVDKAVLVDTSEKSMRLPWAASEPEARGRQLHVSESRQDESLILTGDLYAAVVEWNVIWRVIEPKDYLFSIQDNHVGNAIIAVARSTMHRIVGDYSADEILTGKREEIGLAALKEMQDTLAQYECGIEIVDLQMQRVTPPERVKPAFDEVNASIQHRDQLVNEAMRERNRLIPAAEATRDKLIRGAEGYAARRVAEADGEIASLLAKFEAYQAAPEITRQRLYLEAMERVFAQSGPKTVLDENLKGLVPLLNLNEFSGSGSKQAEPTK